MLPLRPALLALIVLPAAVHAADFEAAMRCVHDSMTSAFVPATASAEQLANVALGRCADEIEMAAVSLAGTSIAQARIVARRELHGYALAVAAGSASGEATAPVAGAALAW